MDTFWIWLWFSIGLACGVAACIFAVMWYVHGIDFDQVTTKKPPR